MNRLATVNNILGILLDDPGFDIKQIYDRKNYMELQFFDRMTNGKFQTFSRQKYLKNQKFRLFQTIGHFQTFFPSVPTLPPKHDNLKTYQQVMID